MIKLHDSEGRPFLLNPASIERVWSAGPNSSRVRTYIRTMTGEEVGCDAHFDSLERMLCQPPKEKTDERN